MTKAQEQVAKEPCRCVRCSMCQGTGRIRSRDWDDTEPCEDCDNGITETCDRCQLLADLDHEDD